MKPFALQTQYVPTVMAARGGEAAESDDEEDEPVKPSKKNAKKNGGSLNTSKRPLNETPEKRVWNYAAIRTSFISTQKNEGKSYNEAVKLWDDSLEKAEYLAPCTVVELKKRRFLVAGSTHNPWYDRLHSS